jgi:hypothetical protein
MLPKRRLSEVITSAVVNKKICHLIVEGPSDKVVIESYCEGAMLPVLIYPVPTLEIDAVVVGRPGGEKGRAVRISRHLCKVRSRRLFLYCGQG